MIGRSEDLESVLGSLQVSECVRVGRVRAERDGLRDLGDGDDGEVEAWTRLAEGR